jgi:hypothetical protein
MLTKYNRKSVTVITDDGQKWTVAPVFLKKYEPATSKVQETSGSNVVRLK